ncbi:MAG: hypothetical protein AB8A39_06190, partial [Prochlorococcus sp.]
MKTTPVRTTINDSFMNTYAISPVPPSNVPGSDYAGTMFTFVWEEDFPYEGEYIFRSARLDEAHLYVDNVFVMDMEHFRGRQAVGTDTGKALKKTMTAGVHQIRVDLLNNPIIENIIRQPVPSRDVSFHVGSGSVYANSIEIVGLFKVGKPYGHAPQLDETFVRTLEFGKVYDVIFRSVESKVEHGGVRLRTRGENIIQMEECIDMDWTDIVCIASHGRFFNLPLGSSGPSVIPIEYTKLNKSNDPIRVTSGGKRIELKDSKGSDTNVSFTIDSGNAKFSSDGKSIEGSGKVKINLTYDDNPNYADEAVRTIKILDVTWTKEKKHHGGETKTVDLGKGGGSSGGGKSNTCKFVVIPNVTGGLESGTVKDGITYEGPTLASYVGGELGPLLSPAWETDYQFRHEFMGREWTSVWKGVNFPTTGNYKLRCVADDWLRIYIDDVEIGNPPDFAAEVFEHIREYSFNASKGIHNIRMDYYNIPAHNRSTFETNPIVFAVEITDKISVSTGHSRSWLNNPTGISAVLLPPPCPRTVEGKGIVTEVEVKDPGNNWPAPVGTSGYPVSLDLVDIIPDVPGINYDCTKDRIVIEPSNGAEAIPVCGGFGQIIGVTMLTPGIGFTRWPNIRLETETGTNVKLRPVFKVRRDPIDIDPDKLIQVTDLVGLKQTGYYDGRPYYGAVFYKEGIRYAGYYETAGQLIPIYDTMQESIDA